MALVRKTLAYAGFNELVTNSMFSEKEHALLTPAVEPVRLKNALNPQMALMRTTLLGSHLQALVYNLNHKNGDNRFFELGRSFTSRGADAFADERDIAAVLIEGSYIPQWWGGPAVAASFSTLKGIVEAFAFQAGLDPVTFGSAINGYPWFEQEFASITAFGGAVTGAMGRVEKRILAFYDIKTPVYWAMLDLTAFLDAVPHINPYQPLPRYPALYRDFAFVMPDAFEAQILTREIHALSDLVEQVRPFDVYRGEKLGTGLKSIAYTVTLRSREKTLTEAEAEAVCRAIVDTMKGKFGIELR